jgi:hypothetical protein
MAAEAPVVLGPDSQRSHKSKGIDPLRAAIVFGREESLPIGEHFLDHTPKKTFDSDHYGQGH